MYDPEPDEPSGEPWVDLSLRETITLIYWTFATSDTIVCWVYYER